MSNYFYESNKAVFDSLLQFIESELKKAEDVDDISKIAVWKKQRDEFIKWRDSSSNELDPIPDETWKLAGLVRPRLDHEILPQDHDPVETLIEHLFTKIETALSQKDVDNSLLADYTSLSGCLDELSPTDRDKYQKDFLNLTTKIIQRRREHTTELIGKIRASENLGDKERLLRDAEYWNPSDEALREEILQVSKEYDLGVSKEEIRQDLLFVQTTIDNDINQFATSLKRLEKWRSQRPEFFTEHDLKIVQEARTKYDNKNVAGGKLTSMTATGNLIDAYIAYLTIQRASELQVIYNDQVINRVDAEAEIRKKYLTASEKHLQNLLIKVKEINQPSAQIGYINQQLELRVDREISGRSENIDGVPLYEDQRNSLVTYRDRIVAEELPFEKEAKGYWAKAQDAKNIYSRVSFLIKSYNSFPMQYVQTSISNLVDEAINERLIAIKLMYEQINDGITRIKEYKLTNAVDQLNKIQNQLETFDTIISEDWFGVAGYDSLIRQAPLDKLSLPTRPEELKQYSLRDGGELRKKLFKAFENTEIAITRIKKLNEQIEKSINDPSKNKIGEAIKTFDGSRNDQELTSFRAYIDLESLIQKHEGLVKKQQRLQQLFETKEYDKLIEYFYNNIDETDAFGSANDHDRKEINKIVFQAQIEQHRQSFVRHINNNNLLAAKFERTWLEKNDALRTTDENQRKTDDNLQEIFNNSKLVEEFYKESFNILLIDQDHPLLTIYSLQESWITGVVDKSLSTKISRFVTGLLDETEKHFSEEKIYNQFSALFIEKSFGILVKFSERILYLSNNFPRKNPEWPERLKLSTISYDAIRLTSICLKLLRNKIKTVMETDDVPISEVRECLSAYDSFNLAGEIEYETFIRTQAFKYAMKIDASLRGENESSEKRYEHWKYFSNLFSDDKFEEEFSRVKKEIYYNKLSKAIRQKEWSDGYQVIEQIKTETIAPELLKLEFDFFTNYENVEYFSSKRAADVIERIRLFGLQENEVKALEAKLIVVEVFEQTGHNLVGAVEILNSDFYLNNEFISEEKNKITRSLSRKLNDEILSKRKNNNINGLIDDIVNFYFLSGITSQDIPNNIKELSADETFKKDLLRFIIATLTGTNQLLTPQGVMTDYIRSIEEVLPTLIGISKYFSNVYRGASGELSRIMGIKGGNSSPTIDELDARVSDLACKKSSILNTQVKIGNLQDDKLWFESLVALLENQIAAGELIRQRVREVENDNTSGFTDVDLILSNIKLWLAETKNLSKDYLKLRELPDIQYDESCKLVAEIGNRITNLPKLFDSDFTMKMKALLNSNIKLTYSGVRRDYVGVENIKSFLEERENQIQYYNNQSKIIDEKAREYDKTLNDLIIMKNNWAGKLTSNEKRIVSDYLDAFSKIVPADYQILPPPEPLENPFAGEVVNQNPGFLQRLFRNIFTAHSRNHHRNYDNETLLKREFKVCNLEYQIQITNQMLKIIENVTYLPNVDEFLSEKSENTHNQINEIVNSLQEKKESIIKLKYTADNIINNTELKTHEKIEELLQANNIGSVLVYYLSVSPYRQLPENQSNLRDILLRRVAEMR